MSDQSKTKQKEAAPPEPAVAPDTDSQQDEMLSPQAKAATSLAQALTPLIAREIVSGRVGFVALTVVVDDKFGITFPYYPFADKSASDQEKFDLKVKTAKIDMLAAVETAKAAARFKHKSLQSLEEGFFEPRLQ